MIKFKNFSIKTKLILLQLLTASVVMAVFAVYIIYNQWKDYRTATTNQLISTARLLGSNTKSSLEFLDKRDAKRVLSSLETHRDIVNAWIYDLGGNLFATYSKKGYADYTFPKTTQGQIQFYKGYIIVSSQIVDDGALLGTIYLRLDTSERWHSLLNNIYTIILALFIGMAIAFVLATIIQKKISDPILLLTDKIEKVTETGNYAIRVNPQSSDEIGRLSVGFNKMMEQIQSRTEALDNAKEQLQTVLDAVPGTISWINSDLIYQGVNRSLADVFNLKPEEFVGKPLGFRGSSPEFVDFVKEFFKSGNKQTSREINATSDGKRYTHLIIGQKYGNDKAAVFIGIDITKIKEAEEAIRVSEERLSLVLEASNTGIWDFDVLNKIAYFSPRWKTILGYRDDEIKNSSDEWEKRLHPNEKQQVIQKFNDYMARPEGQFTLEYRLKHKNGSYIWVSDRSAALVDEQGRTYRMLGSIADITERKQAEKALREAYDNLEMKVTERTRELKEANERLKELDRLKSMFLASMSHELRTPLNSIIGFTGLLLMGMAGELNEEQKKQLGLVKNSAKHLLNLINDILDISKIEAGKIDLDITKFNIKQLVDEVIEEASSLLVGKPIRLEADVDSRLEITSDKRRAKQILINLVSNAIKFTESGVVQITVKDVSAEQVEISVSDTGIGIKEEGLKEIFQPFRQLDMSSSKKYEGTGLGLNLCLRLTKLLGGTISATSVFGEGSVFTFTLLKNLNHQKKVER